MITVQFDVFDLFIHFLHCSVPDNKYYKQKWSVLYFPRIKLVTPVLACTCVITQLKRKRLYRPQKFKNLNFEILIISQTLSDIKN